MLRKKQPDVIREIENNEKPKDEDEMETIKKPGDEMETIKKPGDEIWPIQKHILPFSCKSPKMI